MELFGKDWKVCVGGSGSLGEALRFQKISFLSVCHGGRSRYKISDVPSL